MYTHYIGGAIVFSVPTRGVAIAQARLHLHLPKSVSIGSVNVYNIDVLALHFLLFLLIVLLLCTTRMLGLLYIGQQFHRFS